MLSKELRQPKPKDTSWWPAEFSLPAAEALIDWMPDIVRAELDRYLPDETLRRKIIDAEDDKRRKTARGLIRLLK